MVRRPPLGFVQVVVLPVKTQESDIGVKTVDGRSGGGAASFPPFAGDPASASLHTPQTKKGHEALSPSLFLPVRLSISLGSPSSLCLILVNWFLAPPPIQG